MSPNRPASKDGTKPGTFLSFMTMQRVCQFFGARHPSKREMWVQDAAPHALIGQAPDANSIPKLLGESQQKAGRPALTHLPRPHSPEQCLAPVALAIRDARREKGKLWLRPKASRNARNARRPARRASSSRSPCSHPKQREHGRLAERSYARSLAENKQEMLFA